MYGRTLVGCTGPSFPLCFRYGLKVTAKGVSSDTGEKCIKQQFIEVFNFNYNSLSTDFNIVDCFIFQQYQNYNENHNSQRIVTSSIFQNHNSSKNNTIKPQQHNNKTKTQNNQQTTTKSSLPTINHLIHFSQNHHYHLYHHLIHFHKS